MNKILALYDSDVVYVTRFMEYFSKSEILEFNIVVFTSINTMKQYADSHSIEVLLFGDNVTLEDLVTEHIRYIFRLTDHQPPEGENQYQGILKYQSVKQILMQVLTIISQKEEHPQTQKSGETTILTIVTSIPQLETLSFAWAFSAMRSEQSKTLFTLFDLIPIPFLSHINHQNNNLSDLIYYLKEGNNITSRFHSLEQSFQLMNMNQSIHYLSGIHHCSDLLSLSKEDIRTLFESIRNNTNYETAIFYVSFASEAMMEVLNLSDTVLVLSLDSDYECACLNEWKSQMDRIGLSHQSDKYQFITIHKEDGSSKLPITIQELSQRYEWERAREYLNSCT